MRRGTSASPAVAPRAAGACHPRVLGPGRVDFAACGRPGSGAAAPEASPHVFSELCGTADLSRKMRQLRVRKGCLAQLVERRLYTANVGGSSPSAPTNLHQALASATPSRRNPQHRECGTFAGPNHLVRGFEQVRQLGDTPALDERTARASRRAQQPKPGIPERGESGASGRQTWPHTSRNRIEAGNSRNDHEHATHDGESLRSRWPARRSTTHWSAENMSEFHEDSGLTVTPRSFAHRLAELQRHAIRLADVDVFLFVFALRH